MELNGRTTFLLALLEFQTAIIDQAQRLESSHLFIDTQILHTQQTILYDAHIHKKKHASSEDLPVLSQE